MGSGITRTTPYTTLFSNYNAYAGLTVTGKLEAWGNSDNGGITPTIPADARVIRVFSSHSAFAALLNDGSLVCWGNQNNGGECNRNPAVKDQVKSGVRFVAATGFAMVAVKEDGTAAVWGNKQYGADITAVRDDLSGIISIESGYRQFAALCSGGRVVQWSGCDPLWTEATCKAHNAGVVVMSGAIQISVANYGGAALLASGEVVSWYSSPSSSDKDRLGPGSGIVEIFGSTRFRSVSNYPLVYRLDDDLNPFPTSMPTGEPTSQPSVPTSQPTSSPSTPTNSPSSSPSSVPTCSPTTPTALPTSVPTSSPTGEPTLRPTGQPTTSPTVQSTSSPTGQPTLQPTSAPTSSPTHDGLTYIQIKEVGSTFRFNDNGLYFEGETVFIQLGNQWPTTLRQRRRWTSRPW